MAQLLSCPQGHQWQVAGNGAAGQSCPTCGQSALVQTSQMEQTLVHSVRVRPHSSQTAERLDETLQKAMLKPSQGIVPMPDVTIDGEPTLQRASLAGGTETLHFSPGQQSPIGGYEILGVLGRGGMGVVYKARQQGLNRVVALKMILSGVHAGTEDRVRFKIEAEAVAQLQHPNIVQIYEHGERDGIPFFSLEFLPRGSLQQRTDQGRVSRSEAVDLIVPVARAVHFAHQRGIVHRDLKPANILLAADGSPKITDFGLAKRLNNDTDQTQSGNVVGTPAYMSPEQASGSARAVGPGTDIYALGVMLYEMLTGRPPFQASSLLQAVELVRYQEPPRLRAIEPKIPRDLETICLKCLQKEPSKRYVTAADLADDLDRFKNGEPIHARPVSTWERTAKWIKRHPAGAGLIALAVLVLVGGFGLVIDRWQHAERERRAEIARKKDARLHDAEMFIRFMGELRKMYGAEIIARVQPHGIDVTHDYANREKAVPIWATFAIELSSRFSKPESGQQTRLFSEYPFTFRKDGGPRDDFEREAIRKINEKPDVPFYRFEDYQGRPSLRYAAGDRMGPACVKCHNSHPDSPKKDWKVGDARGVLEIILPLD